MKLIFKESYLSIERLIVKTEPLPEFIVLTGLNGSGKTHLLEAIAKDSVEALTDSTEKKKTV